MALSSAERSGPSFHRVDPAQTAAMETMPQSAAAAKKPPTTVSKNWCNFTATRATLQDPIRLLSAGRGSLQCLDDFFAHFLGVAEQHHRVVAIEQRKRVDRPSGLVHLEIHFDLGRELMQPANHIRRNRRRPVARAAAPKAGNVCFDPVAQHQIV
jgi:hypothetical protein